jgi:hypothetical protein
MELEIKLPKFELKGFRAGKSDYDDSGVEDSFKMGKNLNIRNTVDTLSCNQTLTTDGTGATGADTIVTDLINFWVNSVDGNTYAFGDTGKIYKRTSAGVWSLLYTDAGGEIIGAAEWVDATRTFLVWATATSLHHKLMPGNTGWTDVDATLATWPKTITTASWHTMAQADGALMICNDKKLAEFSYDDSFTTEALALRYMAVAKTVLEYGNNVLVGSADQSNGWLLTWDHTALNWTNKNRIPVKTINAIADAEVMTMNCTRKDGTYSLFFSNMADKMGVLSMDGQCNPGAVAEDDGMALFGVFGGSYPGIWSFGRKKKNGKFAYNLEYYLDADEIGAITFIGSDLFVSYQKGATHGVKKVDTATKASAEYYSLDLEAPRETNWTTIDLLTKSIPTGCSIACYYDLNKTGSWTQAKLQDGSLTATAGRDPIFMIGSNGKIFNLKIVLTPSVNTTPEISKITINFM